MDVGVNSLPRFRAGSGQRRAKCGLDAGRDTSNVVLEHLYGTKRSEFPKWSACDYADVPIARVHRYDTSMMRTYILLGQILPISFTVSLFLIQLHLSSPDIAVAKDAPKPGSTPKRRKPIATLQIPNILLNAALLALPALRSNSVFSLLLLVTRAVLLLPHSSTMSLRDADVVKCITVSGGFAVSNAAMLRKDLTVGSVVGSLGTGGYAVRALGWDAVLGLIVYVVLGWGGGV
jgi:hypothetical protein